MNHRIHSYHLYHELLGPAKSTHRFDEFCQQHGMVFRYITRENKNSELFEGRFLHRPLTFFGKRMPMIPDDFDMLNEKNHVRVDKLLNPDVPYTVWREVFIHRMLNSLLLRRATPHFPFFYGFHFSYDADVYHDGQHRPYILLLQEAMEEDLKTWATREKRTETQWLSCLIQIFFALGVLQRFTGLSHMDMHWGNVLVKRLPQPQSWTYKLPGDEYYSLMDQEFLFTVCDFGCAQFDTRDEMKDYRRISLNIFKWLGHSPGERVDRFVSEIHTLRNRRWKSVLDLVVSKHVSRERTGEVFDGSAASIEFFAPEK